MVTEHLTLCFYKGEICFTTILREEGGEKVKQGKDCKKKDQRANGKPRQTNEGVSSEPVNV